MHLVDESLAVPLRFAGSKRSEMHYECIFVKVPSPLDMLDPLIKQKLTGKLTVGAKFIVFFWIGGIDPRTNDERAIYLAGRLRIT